jgi:hypothetical protein
LADGCDIEEGRGVVEWEESADDDKLYLEESGCEWGFYTSGKWKWGRKCWEQKPNQEIDYTF